ITTNFQPDGPNITMDVVYNLIYFWLVFAFTYFYTAVTFDVNDVADNLKRYSSFIPGIRPGRPTAEYLGSVMNRVTFAGGIFLGGDVKRATPLGKQAEVFMTRGDLVPDELMVEMIRERIRRADCSGGFMLDGFPRTVPQAEALDQMLDSIGQRIDRLLSLHVDAEELVTRLTERWTCPSCSLTYHPASNPPRDDQRCDADGAGLIRREDDNAETARRRAQVYSERPYPILDLYRPRRLAVE